MFCFNSRKLAATCTGSRNNRLIVLFTSINDKTSWPFWKLLQMKKVRSVTDVAMLAFDSEGGSFEARIDGEAFNMNNFKNVKGYKQDILERFLHRWHDSGRSYFIYGGHGMGDYLELEHNCEALQCHELATIMGAKQRYEAMIFDSCFMANLDCAYYLRHNTSYIGACEGYMWEQDTALDYHVFNTFTASAISRYKDPKKILEAIQQDYCGKARRGDFSIIDTCHIEELFELAQKFVTPRVYHRANFYNAKQQNVLYAMAEVARAGTAVLHELPSPPKLSLPQLGRISRQKKRWNKLHVSVQFEHSIYPSEVDDKHLLDLKSYLLDMKLEGEAILSQIAQQQRLSKSVADAEKVLPYQNNAKVEDLSTVIPISEADECLLSPLQKENKLLADINREILLPSRGSSRTSVVSNHGRYPGASSLVSSISSSTIPNSYTLNSRQKRASKLLSLAKYGLGLFNRVVLSYRSPQTGEIYASCLHGLSITVHEFSRLSRPTPSHQHLMKQFIPKEKFHELAETFLKHGSTRNVRMGSNYIANSIKQIRRLTPRVSSFKSSLCLPSRSLPSKTSVNARVKDRTKSSTRGISFSTPENKSSQSSDQSTKLLTEKLSDR